MIESGRMKIILSTKITALFGFLGIGLISAGIIISAFAYQGRQGERYSFLNHFVSELGEYAHSEKAIFFNLGLIFGGLILMRFMLGLASHISGWFGWVLGISGVVISISGALVGVFSMDNLVPHFQSAMTFFYSGLFITIAFSLYLIFLDKGKLFSRWLVFPGAASSVAFFYFLFLTEPLVPEDTPLEDFSKIFENRPNVWETAVFEWVVVFSIISWVLLLSFSFLRKKDFIQEN